ncbi:MAG: T9SS type A sorting domain-containing protein [Saprospiraceae bacterium]|nr:T9SS type A sorting domain-containing protein [Saprospiraceae bacterium]
MRIFTKFIILIVLLTITNYSFAQEGRFTKEVFTKVNVSTQQILQQNFTVMPWVGGLQATPPAIAGTQRQPLRAQFYTPDGDTKTDRPLIIYLHTGNFFPYPVNGSCGGTVTDSVNVEMATRLAKMGYVVAVVEYRQGWLPTIAQEIMKRYTLIQAAYRGVQDVNSYVRYFKKSVKVDSNPHGIDTTKITVWGVGTGGYVSLASAFLNQYSEITNTPGGKWLLPISATATIPMIIEAQNGLIDGDGPPTVATAQFVPVSQLFFKAGDTLSVPNHVGYTSDYALTVNCGGALGDSSWISAGETPIISFHVGSDAFAPCKTAILRVPTQRGPEPVVEVSGSCDVAPIADRKGLNEIFKTIPAGRDPFKAASKTTNLGFYRFEGTPNDSGSPWEWTNAAQPKPATDPNTRDCNTNAVSARRYIDTIIGYFAPRACVALKLNCWSASVSVTDAQVNLKLAPNPATSEINITVAENKPVKSYAIYDISGRMLRNMNDVNSSFVSVRRENLQDGMYLIQLRFEEGVLTKKVIFE